MRNREKKGQSVFHYTYLKSEYNFRNGLLGKYVDKKFKITEFEIEKSNQAGTYVLFR